MNDDGTTHVWDWAPGPQLFLTEPERAAGQRPEPSTELSGLLAASFDGVERGQAERERERASERARERRRGFSER